MTWQIGSLFTGYAGLDLAVEEFFGAQTVWCSDIDPGACRIIAHRMPGVPNLGDITKVNWATVEPVDILTGGFPCQDVSHAGKRAGMRPDTRSGLWTHMAYAIDQLRPRYVIAENVRGLLSARADSDVEPCPWCVGGAADGEPDLRALGAVLGDLAGLGYDARWVGLRAADVGAPHGRFRVFVLATQKDSDGSGRLRSGSAGWGGVLAPDSVRQEASSVDRQSDDQYGSWSAASAEGYARDVWGWPLPVSGSEREASRDLAMVAYRQARAEGVSTSSSTASDGEGPSGGCSAEFPGCTGCGSQECQRLSRMGSGDADKGCGHQEADHEPECTGSCSQCVATDTLSGRRHGWAGQLRPGRRPEPQNGGDPAADADEPGPQGGEPAAGRHLSDRSTPADPQSDGRQQGRPEPARLVGGPDAAQRGDAAADADGNERSERSRLIRVLGSPQGSAVSSGDQRERDWDTSRDSGTAAFTRWGAYEPAIRRWERVLGRLAPPPTEQDWDQWRSARTRRLHGARHSPAKWPRIGFRGSVRRFTMPPPARLSPRFVEWLMGLPAGWVCDVPGLNRNAQLKALGNGVVPQQAYAALGMMLEHLAVAA